MRRDCAFSASFERFEFSTAPISKRLLFRWPTLPYQCPCAQGVSHRFLRALPEIPFFLQFFNELIGSYGRLFNKGAEQGDEEDKENHVKLNTFQDVWGWQNTLDELANGKRRDWDYFIEMNVIEFLNTLSFYKDKQQHLKEQRQLYGSR